MGFDVFRLMASIVLDTSEYENRLNEAGNKTSKFASKLGGGLKKAAAVGAAGMTVAAGGIAALTKASIDHYAEYEQLVGGVETLFKDSADTVKGYAKNAYKTAGMSVNEYMKMVTSFSASLLQSMDNDTAAAAEKADRAVTDMADNANKMGTDMEMIQNAYNGFAKQNYTMLDNLKLGYGGTKEEMERLLADAEKISGIHYDISSYADIVDAIHVVQTEMGITGTTAKEAASTISGSVASMRSAWANLVTGLADDNADIDILLDNFLSSVGTVADNIVPVVSRIVSNIFKKLEENYPQMLQKGMELFMQVAAAALQALPGIVAAIPQIIAAIIKGFVESVPQFADVGGQLITGLWQGIQNKAGWIKEKVTGFFSGIVDSVKSFLGIQSPSKLFRDEIGQYIGLGVAAGLEDSEDDAVKAANKLAKSVYTKSKDWADRQTKYMKLTLGEQIGIWETIQSQFLKGSEQYADAEEKLFDLRQKLWEQELEDQEEFKKKTEEIWQSISDLEQEYQEALSERAQEIFNSYGLFDETPEREKVSGNQLIKTLEAQIATMEEFYAGLEELSARGAGESLVQEIMDMGPDAVDELDALLALSDERLSEYAALYQEKQELANSVAVSELEELRKETDEKIQENLRSLKELYNANAPTVGKAFTDGLSSGIMSGMSSVINSAVRVAQAAVKATKDALGIHSPSTVFAEMGKNMVLGLGEGWDSEYDHLRRNIESGVDFSTANVDFASSGLGIAAAGVVNGVSSATAGANDKQTFTFNLVLPDGPKLAQYLFRPLTAYAKANGTPILNPTR